MMIQQRVKNTAVVSTKPHKASFMTLAPPPNALPSILRQALDAPDPNALNVSWCPPLAGSTRLPGWSIIRRRSASRAGDQSLLDGGARGKQPLGKLAPDDRHTDANMSLGRNIAHLMSP